MKMPISLFQPWIVNQYNLNSKVVGGYIYLQMRKAVRGLPQAGILANKLLWERLAPHSYYECKITPSPWKHTTWPITFTLVVNDFGVKYEQQEDIDHLFAAIKTKYVLTKDWMGDLYCGIKFNWDYKIGPSKFWCPATLSSNYNDIGMPPPLAHNIAPFYPQPKQYGSTLQWPIKPDTYPPLSKDNSKQIKHIIGSILFYVRAVNLTVLMVLSTIANKQAKGTKSTMKKCKQLLDYLATHPNATVCFYTSDMILNVHSNASYLSETNAHSRACGHFFMG
jgi:hypothetical protein